MGLALTPWFNWPDQKPSRAGVYHLQDKSMNCNCCWFEAHWNGHEWHTDHHSRGAFRTLFFDSHVKRWRGRRGVIRLRPQPSPPKRQPLLTYDPSPSTPTRLDTCSSRTHLPLDNSTTT